MREKNKSVAIGFIGGGHMGEALIAACLRKKLFSASQIGVSEPDPLRRRRLARYRIVLFLNNAELVRSSKAILLAVKPQQMREVLSNLKPFLTKSHLIISIAAGLDTRFFSNLLPKGTRLIRVMPNLCAMIGEGAAALYATPKTTPADRQFALKIFQSAGEAVFVPQEELLDTVTAVSGSGPAFVYQFIDALMTAGAKHGLPRDLGKKLVLQTLIGAARMVDRSQISITDMVQQVASKGGTTEAGLKILAQKRFASVIEQTIQAAVKRAKELRCHS